MKGESATVLVVDDEIIVRTLAKLILARGGYRILLAEDGQAGLDILNREGKDIDLALIDLTMPRLGGADLLPEIDRIHPGMPVIFTSGYSQGEALARFPAIQSRTYVQKPFSYDQLLDLVKRALGR